MSLSARTPSAQNPDTAWTRHGARSGAHIATNRQTEPEDGPRHRCIGPTGMADSSTRAGPPCLIGLNKASGNREGGGAIGGNYGHRSTSPRRRTSRFPHEIPPAHSCPSAAPECAGSSPAFPEHTNSAGSRRPRQTRTPAAARKQVVQYAFAKIAQRSVGLPLKRHFPARGC